MPVVTLQTTITSAPAFLARSMSGVHVGLGRIDIGLIDHLGAVLLERRHRGADGGDAIARGVADHGDLFHLEDVEAVIADGVVPLAVRRRQCGTRSGNLVVSIRLSTTQGWMFGILARAMIGVVASASPELVGPQIAWTLAWLINSCVAFTALVGSPWVSRMMISILRPLTPPAALMASTAKHARRG